MVYKRYVNVINIMKITGNYMKDTTYVDDVRTRLVRSGIGELVEHGIREFSLRRVAIAAQVSCAAPYRHFESKSALILEIIRYIKSRHDMFCCEVLKSYSSDLRRALIELSVTMVRFWIANGSFRTVLTLDSEEGWEERRRELDGFDAVLLGVLDEYCSAMKYDDARKERIKYLILALIYGTVTLIGTGKGDIERSIAYMKCEVDTLIDR
jgi:AcrR family transcriptional regulator